MPGQESNALGQTEEQQAPYFELLVLLQLGWRMCFCMSRTVDQDTVIIACGSIFMTHHPSG